MLSSGVVGARQRRYGFGLVSLHIKCMLLARSFAVSENWLALGGAVSPYPERFFKMSKHRTIQKIKNI